jgi:hypothetical protein
MLLSASQIAYASSTIKAEREGGSRRKKTSVGIARKSRLTMQRLKAFDLPEVLKEKFTKLESFQDQFDPLSPGDHRMHLDQTKSTWHHQVALRIAQGQSQTPPRLD